MDLTTAKGMSAFNDFLKTRSYVEGHSFSSADKECFETIIITPDATHYPYAYRWYIHIASLQGIRFLPVPVRQQQQQQLDDDEDIFAGNNGQGPRESRTEMMARVKQEVQEGMSK